MLSVGIKKKKWAFHANILNIKTPQVCDIKNNTKIGISQCRLRLCILHVLWCSVFLYGQFFHGAHKLFDFSTLFTTFFLWTSLPFIISKFYGNWLFKRRYCASNCQQTTYCVTFWRMAWKRERTENWCKEQVDALKVFILFCRYVQCFNLLRSGNKLVYL